MLGYPIEMQESIRKLEETRAYRLSQKIPRLSYEDRYKLLQEFHPDFNPEGVREVRIGPNKGELIKNELVDLLEAYSLVEPERVNLKETDFDVDVLVIGGGGGGAAAALTASEANVRVMLATKLRMGDSNTIMAEGGIAAATQPKDSPYWHYIDTIGGGRFQNKRELVWALVHDAPLVIDWLKKLGVMFNTDAEGELVISHAGGHCRRRIHPCKDLTGMEVMRVLRDELWNRGVEILEFSPAVELLLDENGNCAGAILMNLETKELLLVRAKAVILATGGIGRLHPNNFPTTNHYGATADGLVIGYRAGANLLHMDVIQYHPTGVVWPDELLGQLITEAMRGNGAQLVNVNGERFINELEPRDVTASAIIREVRSRKKGIKAPSGLEGVWLDVPLIDIIGGEGKLERLFAGIVHRFAAYGIDVRREPILVFPTQHYQNGGIEIDPEGRTKIEGLYAVGEVSGGVHGKNRLGGNALLDIFVFGRRAGKAAAAFAKNREEIKFVTLEHVKKYNQEVEELGIEKSRRAPILLPDYRRTELIAKMASFG